MHPVRALDADEVLRDKIKEKRQKYGQLSKPLLIVVNAIYEGFFIDDYTVMCALFGKETINFITYQDGSQKTTHSRDMNGAWVSPRKILGGVSGILILPGLYGWNLDKINPKLWIHPKANHPLNAGLLKVLHKIHNSETDKMEEIDYGASGSEQLSS